MLTANVPERTADYITPNNGCETFAFDHTDHLLLRRTAPRCAALRCAARLSIGVGVISYVSRKYQPRSAIVQRLYLQHVPRRRFPVAGCHRFYYHRENNFRPISEYARQCATVSGEINKYFNASISRRISEMPVKLESDLTSEEHYGCMAMWEGKCSRQSQVKSGRYIEMYRL